MIKIVKNSAKQQPGDHVLQATVITDQSDRVRSGSGFIDHDCSIERLEPPDVSPYQFATLMQRSRAVNIILFSNAMG